MKRVGCAIMLFWLIYSAGITDGSADMDVQLVEWDQADRMIPRFSKFTVHDLETGKQFQAQRRAGSGHADVQPLSRRDTAIMKSIYGGEWSWKRRSIIVKTGNKNLAASMHGMPHGAGALENGFPGHFCIHFYGSKTHRTKSMDLSHKLMILKSAGQLYSYLAGLNAEETADVFLAGLKQEDKTILSMVTLGEEEWSGVFSDLENLSFIEHKKKDLQEQLGAVSVPVKAKVYLKEHGQKDLKLELRLVKISPLDPWRVDSKMVIDYFKRWENKVERP